MNTTRVIRGAKKQRTEVKDHELEIIMRTLMTASADDVLRLQELDILNESPDLDGVEMRTLSKQQWREATNYRTPKSVKDAYSREPDERAAWKEAIEGELDWFIENGKVEIMHKDTAVPPEDIPPYKWNAEMLTKLRLVDLSRLEGLKKKQDRAREAKGGKVDECFDILKWTWDFVRKMAPVLDENDQPTKRRKFKKCRARACIMGNDQIPLHTYDPLRVSAAVVHPACIHLVNIIIVSFGLMVFKIDDPKAFCQGDADYPIFTKVPRGVEDNKKYAPWGHDTRWKVQGAIYGLIQASLRYFLKSKDVMEGIGFRQCAYAKTVFIKHFHSQRRFIIFWQHVDDRWGGCQDEKDLEWFVGALKEQLNSAREAATDVLGLDCEYDRQGGVMRLRATTKIAAFLEKGHYNQVTMHDTPMTPSMVADLTIANCPATELARLEMSARDKVKEYRTCVGFFCYTTNTVFVHCRNAGRILSKFLSNPGKKHYEACMHAVGFLRKNQHEYIEYRRGADFNGEFRIFTMVDADLGGCHVRGKNGNSVMAGVTFVNGSHCYSYSKTTKATCLGTHHTEYYGLTEGGQMTIWIACVLRDLEFPVSYPIPIVADNQSALATACVPETKNSRHINLREHWIRDVMEKGDLVVGFIRGVMNAANVGTKILPRAQFQKEGGWYLRGIHGEDYQDEIQCTLSELWMRSHQWHVEQEREAAKHDNSDSDTKKSKQKGSGGA
jgi:hypothetical protein